MENILKSVGLTENESKVYLELLRLGSTSTGPLIKKLGMHRAAVYDTIDMLIEKGLVSFVIKANRKYFEAHDPERLSEYLESKKQLIEEQEQELKKEIPKLQNLRILSKEKQEGYVYKGMKGIKSVLEDVLKEGKLWFVFGSKGQFEQALPSFYIQFHKKRERLKIPMKIIRSEIIRKREEKYKFKFREVRYLPEESTTPSTTMIYGDKLAVIVWSEDPMAFVVRSKTAADSYRKYFDVMWKAAKT